MSISTITNTVSPVQLVWDTIGVETVLLTCFIMGYLFFNSAAIQQRLRPGNQKLAEKQLAAHLASGMYEAAMAMKAETVEMVVLQVQALVENKRASEVSAFLESCARVPSLLTSAAMQQVVREIPESVAADVKAWFASKGVADDSREALLVSSITSDWKRAVELAQEDGMPARARVRVAKESLRRDDLSSALAVMKAAQAAGFFIPAHLLAAFVTQGLRSRDEATVLADLEALTLSSEAVAGLVGALTKESDSQQLEIVLKLAEKAGRSYAALEAVFKTLAKTNDQRAFEHFDRLLAEGPLQEATAVAVLGFCADGHNVPLAERVFSTAREQGCGSVVVYSALMRVYAVCRLFHKSCDLYTTLESDGLEPDTVMYGGLIKAAVECGRLDLSRKLLRESGTMDIQNYMSLFRACGREKNSRKAMELLAELETSNVGADTTAYNCVLDVCICGDWKSVADLFTKMKVTGYVDTISYNTLLKGMGPGATGLTDANMVLAEMRTLNLKPNQITYNSLINYAISRGDLKSAWGFVESMQEENVQVDHFTCSIMMKGLRTASQPTDVDRTIALIERSAVAPDEVLVNTLLDACIRLRDVKRLTGALSTFRKGGVVPSDHAYGSVFKAYGHARALDEAWACWNDMLARQVSPSDGTVQAMVDALVQCGAGSDAKKVLDQAAKMGSKPTSYITLLKTLVQKRDLQAVLDLYASMPAASLTLSAYNMIIDACARQGDAEKGAEVFKAMMAAGVTPDVTTYSAVIKAYVVQGDLEQAVQLFTLMRKRGVHPDVGLFNTLLDGLARKQMSALVGHVLQDMETSSVTPTPATLAILVKMYGRAHDLDSAFAYVDSWQVKYNLEANAQVLVALLTACANAGDMARAQGVFGELRAPDAKAYTAMVQGHLKAQNVKDAVRLLESAVNQQVVLEQELIDNAIFMAGRRNISSDSLTKKLTAQGYKVERSAPEQTITRRKQGKWREAVAA
jgi:pentatricopeptide repeat protein